MSKPITFNYGAADAATGNVGSLVAAMQQNTSHLRTLYTQLMQDFNGYAASGYDDVMRDFHTKLDAYDGKVKGLNTQVSANVNSGGHMNQVDIAQGNRFGAIKA